MSWQNTIRTKIVKTETQELKSCFINDIMIITANFDQIEKVQVFRHGYRKWDLPGVLLKIYYELYPDQRQGNTYKLPFGQIPVGTSDEWQLHVDVKECESLDLKVNLITTPMVDSIPVCLGSYQLRHGLTWRFINVNSFNSKNDQHFDIPIDTQHVLIYPASLVEKVEVEFQGLSLQAWQFERKSDLILSKDFQWNVGTVCYRNPMWEHTPTTAKMNLWVSIPKMNDKHLSQPLYCMILRPLTVKVDSESCGWFQ
jgi:hypothetical protein